MTEKLIRTCQVPAPGALDPYEDVLVLWASLSSYFEPRAASLSWVTCLLSPEAGAAAELGVGTWVS